MENLKFFTKGTGNHATIYSGLYEGRKFDYQGKTSFLTKSKYSNNKKGEVKQVAENGDKLEMTNKLSTHQIVDNDGE